MNELTQQRLDALLQANSMTPDRLDQTTLSQMFLAQMRVALYGGVSSIPVLPTFLKPFGTLHEGTPVAVAEIDDREVRVSLVTFSGGRAEVTDADRFPVPGREYPAPLADLLFAVAELAQPLLDRAKALALCLPFPIDYDWQGDGAIRSFPGTMTVSDFAQTPVLAALREEWKSRNVTPPPMTLVSLPAAVQLAAGALHPGQKRYVSLTWGSVFDLGFTAPGSIVVRQAGTPPALTPFACGFGHAQCVPFGLVDLILDRDSGRILDAECNIILGINSDYIASLLVGRNFYQELDEIILSIQQQYFGPGQRALIVCLKDAYSKMRARSPRSLPLRK